MASWRVSKSLLRLRDQVNARYPNRKKDWDGTIGDAAHASRKSDHNPDAHGVVRAMDITHDPTHGFDSYRFADELKASGDKRLSYVISNRRIWNPSISHDWRPYSGSNPHDHHVHISVVKDDELADSETNWQEPMLAGSSAEPSIPVAPGDQLRLSGKVSWFGGPADRGVSPSEGLAFISKVSEQPSIFLPKQPPGTTGLARRLDPAKFYVACRWDYKRFPKATLLHNHAIVSAPKTGRSYAAWPADWGPSTDTNRVADISLGLMTALGIQTDDMVEVAFPAFPTSTVKETPMTDTTDTAPAPVIVAQQPAAKSTAETVRGWVHTALGGILTAIGLYVGPQIPGALKPPPVPIPIVDPATVNNAVNTALDPSNPKLRDVVIKIIQTGVPGEALQTGLGLIPGASPFANALEPILRKIVIDALQQLPQQLPQSQPTLQPPAPPRRPIVRP